ncbi:MAG: phosphatidylserine decarboxylase family protein [Bacteroidota bacterium]
MAFRLHKEAKVTLPISLLVVAALWVGGYLIHPVLGYILAVPGAILVFLLFNFFRNPDVPVAQHAGHILAPCDGKVVVIEEVEDEHYFKGKVTQVSIFMSPLNVHVNRNPIGGTVKMVKYFPGKYLMAFNPKSSTLNEQSYVVAGNDKVSVAYKQIAGFLARRIRYYVKEGDPIEQGAEYGFIKFGSRIDLLIPLDCTIKVELDQVVKAGRSLIAEIPA